MLLGAGSNRNNVLDIEDERAETYDSLINGSLDIRGADIT